MTGEGEREWGEERIIALLDAIQEGAEQARQIRALHPDAEMLAEGLRIHTDLLEATLQVRHLERVSQVSLLASQPLSDREEMRWHPADGSPAAQEMAWASAAPVAWDGTQCRKALASCKASPPPRSTICVEPPHSCEPQT